MSLLVRYLLFLTLVFTCSSLLAFDQFETFAEDGKYGLINTETQEVVLEARYEAVGWSQGEFKVFAGTIGINQNGKWALASVEGKRITAHNYTSMYPWAGELLIAGERNRFSILSKSGVINTRGKVIIPLEYDRVSPADQQLIVGTLTLGEYQYGLLSKSGKAVIPKKYSAINFVEEGIFSVQNDAGFSAIFSAQGRQLSPFEFENITPYDDDRLLVTYYNRKGLVDKLGKVVIPPVYKYIQLENGRTRAQPFKKWTFFGEAEPKDKVFYFDKVLPLADDVFAIQTNNNIGLVSREEAYIAYFTDLELISAAHGLAIVSNGQYQGVMNRQGKFVLPLNYDRIVIMPEVIFGEIKRQNGQNWQNFDHKGVPQSRLLYESFSAISENLILARRRGKHGVLNQFGNEITPFVYDSIRTFKNKIAVVDYQGNQGVINEDGHWVITPYKDSLAIYRDYIYYRFGSENGTLDFDENVNFRTQSALTPVGEDLLLSKEREGWQLVDYKGQKLTDPYDSIFAIHDHLYALQKNSRFWLFRPSTSEKVAAPEGTESLETYAEDVIAIKLDGQWGFIGEQGQLRIANRYEAVQPFSEALAAVKLIGKWGVINRQEEIVIQPIYDSIGAFYGGLTLVERNGLYGMVDREGKPVLDVQYDHIELKPKHIILKSGDLYGLADRKGNIVRSPQYDKITALSDRDFLLRKAGKYGVVSIKGQDKVPVAFESITPVGTTFLAAEPSQWVTPKLK